MGEPPACRRGDGGNGRGSWSHVGGKDLQVWKLAAPATVAIGSRLVAPTKRFSPYLRDQIRVHFTGRVRETPLNGGYERSHNRPDDLRTGSDTSAAFRDFAVVRGLRGRSI